MLAHIPRRLWRTGREAAAAYSLNLCPQLASAIAYRVLFSLFPLAIFLISIFGLLIENDERRNEIVTWIVDNLLLSPEGSVRLDEAVAGLATPTSALGLVALLGVLWGASGMMAAIRVALTNVWGTERRQAWRGKAFDLLLVLLAGVLLLVAFSLTLVVRLAEDMGSQVGSALGAALAGWIYEWTGGYDLAFVSAAVMGFLAAGLSLAIREEPIASAPTPLAAPATS